MTIHANALNANNIAFFLTTEFADAVAHPTWYASIPPSPATRSNALVCRLMPGPASSLLGAHDSMHRVIVSSA